MRMVYFAWIRQRIGESGEDLEVPDGIETVDALLDWLVSCGAGYAAALADRSVVRVALDQKMVGPEARLAGVNEVALFPPVTGG